MMNGKTVLLTGASGGIGRAIATQLDSAGMSLILVGRNLEKLEQLNGLFSHTHIVVQADISNELGRVSVLEHCQALNKSIDVLINNAGVGQFDLFETMNDEAISRIIHTNLLSTILLTHSLLPLLKTQDRAQIINIGSTFGSIGYPGYSVYSASKFGIRGFTEALRRELMDSNISVQYFAPRATKTSINSSNVEAMNKELGVTMDGPQQVAKALLAFIQTYDRQKFVGWPETVFARINGVLPGLVERAIVKQLPRIKYYLTK